MRMVGKTRRYLFWSEVKFSFTKKRVSGVKLSPSGILRLCLGVVMQFGSGKVII